eukprot:CAMPEP_0185849882 /NCGR_PEP_ID=MMETSP1354-20130828/4228_1 /TAXON_ID=708628 /ORGANISM="Erythrolobus madagascarensis, Strain CCMP3276" /LENGTH=527 /DNA_ID=CAMNT_0028550485 /DNA_START=33 /DNA_END=1616 /DNA_ORIENTATION=-
MSGFVKVRCFNGKTYEVTTDTESASVSELQEKIAALSSIGVQRQTLLYKGQMLDAAGKLADFGVADGATINVVRRMASTPASTTTNASSTSASSAPPTSSTTASALAGNASADKSPNADSSAPGVTPGQQPDLASMLAGMGLGGAAGAGAGAGADNMDLNAMMSALGGGGAGAGGAGSGGVPDLSALLGEGAGGAGGAAGLEEMMRQMPQLMNGLWQSDAMQDYLNDESKQEASREAIKSNPMLQQWLAADPEFAKVVNDPTKWKESMNAARNIFAGAPASGDSGASGPSSTSTRAPGGRKTAADCAPAHINMGLMAEAYGHALGQSMVNSGLGFNLDLVIRGLRNAAAGREFPMPLPEYEKKMGELQIIAAELTSEANQKDADSFMEKAKSDSSLKVLKAGKLLMEDGANEDISKDEPVVIGKEATVLVILQGRLLDERTFFTCPAADDEGQMVHPLTLDLRAAPPALADGIVGMREGEERTLYVHPSFCDGMTDLFGEMLPPNALLIFEVELVSANAPPEQLQDE